MAQPAVPLLKIAHSPQTLREIVLERLRGAIISGQFGSGDRLVERTMCEQLGVSRTVVREAFRYLEAEGLVEILPNRGPIVARLDWAQARQIYDIRMLLEESAAAACASRADAETKARLVAALAVLAQAHVQADASALFEATTGFYQVIFDAAGHDVAWEIVQRLNGRISRLRAMTLATTDRHVWGQARMTLICDAILAGDPTAAAAAVREHLLEAASIARRLLDPTPRDTPGATP